MRSKTTREALEASSRWRCASAARMLASETSSPTSRADGRASAGRKTSEPVPHPRSRTTIARSRGAYFSTICDIRADRSGGAEQVLSANWVDNVDRALESEPIRPLRHVVDEPTICRKHGVAAAESQIGR